MKTNSHDSFISGTVILETDQYDSIAEIADKSSKNSILSVMRIHLDLIVDTQTINKGKLRVPSGCFDQHIIHLSDTLSSGRRIQCSNWSLHFSCHRPNIGYSGGWWISLIKPTYNNFLISCLICTSSFCLKFLEAYLTGLVPYRVDVWPTAD